MKAKRQQIVKFSIGIGRDNEFNTFGDFHRLVCVRTREGDAGWSDGQLGGLGFTETWYAERDLAKSDGPPVRILTPESVNRALRAAFFHQSESETIDVVTEEYDNVSPVQDSTVCQDPDSGEKS